MDLLNFAVELSFTVDLNSLVQVLLENTESLVNFALLDLFGYQFAPRYAQAGKVINDLFVMCHLLLTSNML